MATVKDPPSRAWYVVSGVLFVLCALGAPVIFVVFFLTSFGSGQQFKVPGATALDVSKPGTYVLWYDHATFFEGRAYQSDDRLPNGLQLRIVERGTDREVPMTQGLGGSESSGSEKRSSVGEFEAARPGVYLIEVTGNFEQRVFSVRRSLAARFFLGIVGLIGLELLGWIGAPLIAIIVFLRRRKAAAQT
jgi:hypothetical protein